MLEEALSLFTSSSDLPARQGAFQRIKEIRARRQVSGPRRDLRLTAYAMLTVVAVIACLEVLYRMRGGLPSVPPGLTRNEFQWRVQRADPSRSVFVVGDSRVGWGFAGSEFTNALRVAGVPEWQGVNAGMPASSVSALVDYVVDQADPGSSGVLVVNFSPASFYHFGAADAVPAPGDAALQRVIDDRLRIAVQKVVTTHARGLRLVVAGIRQQPNSASAGVSFVQRTVHPEGFVTAKLEASRSNPRAVDGYQLRYYSDIAGIIGRNRAAADARRDEVVATLRTARERGWDVVMIRLPIGPNLRAIETLPPELDAPYVARLAGVRYIDYNRDRTLVNAKTLDESHLAPIATRALSRRIADDLVKSGLLGRRG